MANVNWVAQTNQRLYQCQLLLAEASRLSDDVAGRALAVALEDGAIVQLLAAYKCYLNELAEAVNHRQLVTDLEGLISSATLVTGDMKQFQQLESDGYSWLAELKRDHDGIGLPQALSQPVVAVTPGLIASSSVMPSRAETVATWMAEFQSIIDIQRDNKRES